eukprot:TRINITY_DN74137_c0_g1_i1.p2 TRINITY_DN74137_c0_g1~~TRINITY_DN74137_c0_g1_i1.p2  ORF type:complete len:153 (+),score=27.33 TRINITY_DN74137_c0_g1_i1:104-562(+)
MSGGGSLQLKKSWKRPKGCIFPGDVPTGEVNLARNPELLRQYNPAAKTQQEYISEFLGFPSRAHRSLSLSALGNGAGAAPGQSAANRSSSTAAVAVRRPGSTTSRRSKASLSSLASSNVEEVKRIPDPYERILLFGPPIYSAELSAHVSSSF